MRCLCGATVINTKRHILSEAHKRYIERFPDIEAQRTAQDLEEARDLAAYLGLNADDAVNELRRHDDELKAYYVRDNSENKTEHDQMIIKRIELQRKFYDNYKHH